MVFYKNITDYFIIDKKIRNMRNLSDFINEALTSEAQVNEKRYSEKDIEKLAKEYFDEWLEPLDQYGDDEELREETLEMMVDQEDMDEILDNFFDGKGISKGDKEKYWDFISTKFGEWAEEALS